MRTVCTLLTLIGPFLGCLLGSPTTSTTAERPVFSVANFGADLSDDQPDDDAFSKCLQRAIAEKGTCQISEGTLTLTKYAAELRQDGQLTANRDLGGLVIEGAGINQTTVKGISARGFDVFQLNGVEHLTIRSLTITAEKTSQDETQGVNGVSMTNGTAHVTIEHVAVRKLPYVVKPGRYDGGKGFTVQQGTLGAASCTEIVVQDCEVTDSPIGFGLDADPNQKALPGKITVRKNSFERVALGFSLSFSGKNAGGADVPGFGIEIAENTLVDVTRVAFLGRAPDVVFRDNAITTTQVPDLPDPVLHPGIPLVLIGSPRANFEGNTFGYQPKLSTYLLIGAAGGNVNADKVVFTGNQFTGPAEVGVKLLNPGVTNSKFTGNSFTGAAVDRDPGLNHPRLKNTWSVKRPAAKSAK